MAYERRISDWMSDVCSSDLMHILRRHGIALAGYRDDTLLESFVLNATGSRHDMDSLARNYLGYTTTTFEQVSGKGAKQTAFSQVDVDTATDYADEEADIPLRLHRVLAPCIAAEQSTARASHEYEMRGGRGAERGN